MNQRQKGNPRRWMPYPLERRYPGLERLENRYPYHVLRPLSSDGTDLDMYGHLSSGAAGPLHHGSTHADPSLRSQQASFTFVYCIELPGFQCRSSSAQRELSASQIGQLNGLNLSLFGGANSFNIFRPNLMGYYGVAQPLPQYTMVKVGITSNLTHPAKRVYNIMRGLKGFGASEEETKFTSLKEEDSLDDTFTKGKREDNIIFFKKCCSIGEAEKKIRQLIGRDLGESFRDHFKEKLGRDKQGYVDEVGMTEWVLIRTSLMKSIQREFRGNWPKNSMFPECRRQPKHIWWSINQCPTGEQFRRQIENVLRAYKIFANLAEEAHKVTITFSPTKFSYDVDIEHPRHTLQ